MKRQAGILVLVAALGCDKFGATPSADAGAADEAARKEAAEQDRKRKEEERRKAQQERKKALQVAAKAFSESDAATAEDRLAHYLKLVKEIEESKELLDIKPYERFQPQRAKEILGRLDELKAEEEKEAKSAPDIPEKPENKPPQYMGAFRLSGTVKGCDRPGVGLKSGSKYYYVEGATCPDRPILWGYVEDAGRTVTLSIGRDGREAKVVTISSKETMQDDRRTHRESLKAYQEDYRRKLKEYQEAIAKNRSAVQELEKSKAAREAGRKQLYAELDRILVSLAESDGKSGGGANQQAAQQPAAASQPAAPAAAPVVNKPKIDRAACIRQCIATCNDDANCERSCASSKCR